MTKKDIITERKIYKVSDWNRERRGTILAYTLGNGSMLDEPRKNGYVVQKIHLEGGNKSRFFKNYALALSYFYKPEF